MFVVLFVLCIGLILDEECCELMVNLLVVGCYEVVIDCELVYEILSGCMVKGGLVLVFVLGFIGMDFGVLMGLVFVLVFVFV